MRPPGHFATEVVPFLSLELLAGKLVVPHHYRQRQASGLIGVSSPLIRTVKFLIRWRRALQLALDANALPLPTLAMQATKPMIARAESEKFPAIDVLRALAALAVVACHCTGLGRWPPESLGWIAQWTQYGWLGVDLFFVISGFVITNSALKLSNLPWRDYARIFWVRRAARILPLYYFTLLAFLLLVDHGAVTGDNALKQIVTHALLIHQWWPETAGSINGVTWTLGIEILFYLLAWLLVGMRTISPGRSAAVILFTIIVTIAYRLVVFALVPELPQRVFFANQVFGVLDGFMMGTAIAVWRSDPKNVSIVQVNHFFSLPTLLILSGVATLILALAILNANAVAFWEQPVIVGGFRTLVGVAFALVVLGAVQLPHTLRIPRPLRFLGDISYGIYLWHYLLLLWLQKSFDLAAAPLVLMTLLTTLSAASVTFFLVEAPAQRLAKKITSLPN